MKCIYLADVLHPLPVTTGYLHPGRWPSVTVGDLDITGNQVTVEANFNWTAPFRFQAVINRMILVSKHAKQHLTITILADGPMAVHLQQLQWPALTPLANLRYLI